jgi:hypothetical protein
MNSESVVVLPPYWFALDAFDAISLNERIEKLVEIREKINGEILYLKSMILTSHKKFNLVANNGF